VAEHLAGDQLRVFIVDDDALLPIDALEAVHDAPPRGVRPVQPEHVLLSHRVPHERIARVVVPAASARREGLTGAHGVAVGDKHPGARIDGEGRAVAPGVGEGEGAAPPLDRPGGGRAERDAAPLRPEQRIARGEGRAVRGRRVSDRDTVAVGRAPLAEDGDHGAPAPPRHRRDPIQGRQHGGGLRPARLDDLLHARQTGGDVLRGHPAGVERP